MLCTFMGGCSDLVGCPLCEKIEWLKNLSISEGMLRPFNSSMVMYLTTPTFIRRMLCMFIGGCVDLIGCPLWGKIEWLKDLSISEGMLRHFNSSMVRYLTMPMVHALYDTGNSINCGSVYFVLRGVSPGRELPCGPG